MSTYNIDATDSYAADMDRADKAQREAERHAELVAKFMGEARSDAQREASSDAALVNELVCEGLANACEDPRNMLLLSDPLAWAMWARDLYLREVQSWAAKRADEAMQGRLFDPDYVPEVEE